MMTNMYWGEWHMITAAAATATTTPTITTTSSNSNTIANANSNTNCVIVLTVYGEPRNSAPDATQVQKSFQDRQTSSSQVNNDNTASLAFGATFLRPTLLFASARFEEEAAAAVTTSFLIASSVITDTSASSAVVRTHPKTRNSLIILKGTLSPFFVRPHKSKFGLSSCMATKCFRIRRRAGRDEHKKVGDDMHDLLQK